MMKQNYPVTQATKVELEARLAHEKERFLAASRKGAAALKTDLSVATWIEGYPYESAMLIVMGGYVAARIFSTRNIPRKIA